MVRAKTDATRTSVARTMNNNNNKINHWKAKKAARAAMTRPGSKVMRPTARETVEKWFDSQFDEVRPSQGSGTVPNDELVQQAQKRAEELLSREIARFSKSYRCQNRADADWLDMVSKGGTFPDRLSALQLRIHRSAVYALPQLRQFVALAQRKGAKIRQAHTLNKALKELFLHELLPPKRKLLKLSQRPLEKWANSTKPEAERRLLMWHFEAELKQLYHQFIEGLQSLAGNTAEGVALVACQDMAELLAERPEQEQQLLAALVNKLGHPIHRVGSGVAQCLERTVAQQHPNMRSVLITEVETLLFRKNISPKAQQYAVHFLSRIILDAGETELALQLIRIYLKLFHILVTKDALAEYPKLLPLLVSGLNRAFPYAKGRTSEVLDNIDSLYTIVQTAKFSTALSVLRLLFQIHNASDGLSDRFYAAFYRRLLNLQPGNQQHDTQLFALAQQILRNDLVELRVRAFLKRFFQIALSGSSAFAAAILLMCHSVVWERPQLIRMEWTANNGQGKLVNKTAVGDDDADGDDEEHYHDVQLSSDEDDKAKAAKRRKKTTGREEREEEERDEKKEKEEKKKRDEKKGEMMVRHDNDDSTTSKRGRKRKKSGGWVHRREAITAVSSSSAAATVVNGAAKRNSYNPTARNPLFAGAEWALDDELGTLAHHFHPTVASFAQAVIKGQPIAYRGDPLIDLSQMRFLDRFAFKNPKKQRKLTVGVGGDAGTENGAGPSPFAHLYTPSGVKALNPTSQDYLSKKSSEIPLDERFLHHFATVKFQKREPKVEDEDDEVASLDSDEFDMLMDRFEPGESREVFDVDFGTEFGKLSGRDNKNKRALERKRAASMSDEEDDDEEEESDDEDDGEEEEDDEKEDDEDEDDEEEDGGSVDDEEEFEYDDDDTDGDEQEEEELEFG